MTTRVRYQLPAGLASAVVLFVGSAAPAQTASARKPSDQELRASFAKAQEALQNKDYAAAERDFKAFLQLDPNNPAGYTNLGVVYMRTQRYGGAIQAFEIARKLDP
jgi:Flp pilus assembly protein TadD